jgi:hypothetical protein
LWDMVWDGRFRAFGLMSDCIIHSNHRCAELRYRIDYYTTGLLSSLG